MAPTALVDTQIFRSERAFWPEKRPLGSHMAKSNSLNGTSLPAIHSPRHRNEFGFDQIEDALAAFERGEFLVVMDDENRENEGDLIISASQCTTEKMAWMIKHTRYETFYAKPSHHANGKQRLHMHSSAWRASRRA